MQAIKEETYLQGVPISDGIAIGIPFFLHATEEPIPKFSIPSEEIENELLRYKKALDCSRADLLKLQSYLAQEGTEDAMQIIDTHVQMLDDPLITTAIEEQIRSSKENIESIFSSVIDSYEKKFKKTTDPFFKQRLTDVIDLAKRIQSHLCIQSSAPISKAPKNSLLVSKELTPSDAAAVDRSRIEGIITQEGGFYSHAALIARAKRIPLVADIDISKLAEAGQLSLAPIIIDGGQGVVIINPERETLKRYSQLKSAARSKKAGKRISVPLRAETRDGRQLDVLANVGSMQDLEEALDFGADGIGLLRTEYIFLEKREDFPNEEEQYEIFSHIIKNARGSPIVMRVFDIGGDKSFGPAIKEVDALLSSRGIRFLLKYKEIFRAHLRAVLRAAQFGDVRILLPLVSDVKEIQATKALIAEIAESLGQPQQKLPIGCMIELPAAAMGCDALAAEVDFLSLGTNDLIHYALGLDRSHSVMNDWYFPLHPSILFFLKAVIGSAQRAEKSLTVCGELASNPVMIPFLMGLGITRFSCAPRYISTIKRVVKMSSYEHCRELAESLDSAESAEEIFQKLLQEYDALLPFKHNSTVS